MNTDSFNYRYFVSFITGTPLDLEHTGNFVELTNTIVNGIGELYDKYPNPEHRHFKKLHADIKEVGETIGISTLKKYGET